MAGEVKDFCPFRSTIDKTVKCHPDCALAINRGVGVNCVAYELWDKLVRQPQQRPKPPG
jgi:hypothetical protein